MLIVVRPTVTEFSNMIIVIAFVAHRNHQCSETTIRKKETKNWNKLKYSLPCNMLIRKKATCRERNR